MYYTIKKILFLWLAIALPFATLQAQHNKKKKKVKRHTVKPVGFRRTSIIVPEKHVLADLTPKKSEPIIVSIVPKDTLRNQADTTVDMQKEVIITSSFKPSLRNAAKINFTSATPILDTSKIELSYSIPSQNLFFSYQPIPIKPLALAVDSGYNWNHHLCTKVGFGNYSSPYVEAGASFGDGKNKMLTAHGKYQSAKGSLPNQQYAKAGIDLLGNFTTKDKHEITTKLFWDNNTVYKYGYLPDSLKFNKDSLKQNFNTIGVEASLENKIPTTYGITYHPMLKLYSFFNTSNTKETNLIVNAPISKQFGKLFNLDIAANADLSHYTNNILPDTASINNNLFQLNTSVRFITPNLKTNIGLLPSWDNSTFSLLPNFTAEGKLLDKALYVEAGWIGYYEKNNYKNLVTINPYIAAPINMFNTKTTEEYIGLKGSIDNHLSGNVRLSFLKLSNAALFANDITAFKNQNFLILNEPAIQALRVKGEVSYNLQNTLSVLASATYTKYTKQSLYDKAYGLIPLEINGTINWKLLDDLTIKSDVFFMGGNYYSDNKLNSLKLAPAIDANIGAEFPVMKKVNGWLQFNNFINNKYQRWNQYQVLGFQILAGVVYSFR